MTGYHFTAYSNWLSIQKDGLVPYHINKPEIDRHFTEPVKGIWTWDSRPTGKSELGSILFQTSTKQSTRIVLLEFDYEMADRLKALGGGTINLFHDGHLGSWLYHKDQPAHIVTKVIPPSDIRLIKHIDLMDIVR